MQPKRPFKRSESIPFTCKPYLRLLGLICGFLSLFSTFAGDSLTDPPAFACCGAIFAAHRAFRGMPCPFSLQLGKIPDRSSFCSSYGKILPVSCSLHALYENSPIPTRHSLTPRRLRRNPIGLDFIRGKIHVMLFSSAPTSP